MHDCPQCQVPLHGHEAFCPVCGQKQTVRPQFRGLPGLERGFNPLGLILIMLIIGGVTFYAVQSSWVGQLIRRGPDTPVGDAALSPAQAREKLENGILQNLAGQAKTCKFIYTAEEKTVDRNYPKLVELAIDVYLKDPTKRKTIVEPVKSLMVPGHINTLTFTDNHSHATITYSVSGVASDDQEDTAGQNTNTSNTDSQ